MNRKIYLHEFIDIIGQNRAAYIEHMASFVPKARINKGMRAVGLWGTIGSTDRWPEAVNLWEMDGWHGVAASLDHETASSSLQDPDVEEWWAAAAPLRTGGFDRLLVPSDFTPDLEELVETGVKGHVYYHLVVAAGPGRAGAVLDVLGDHLGTAADHAMTLVGAYRTALCNDSEAVAIYALPSWSAWADFEEGWASDGALGAWRKALASASVDWKAKILRPGPRCPLNLGEIR
jgi:hypothetical protein